MDEVYISLRDCFHILKRAKWKIGLATVVFTLVAALVSIILPKTYETRATVLMMPPKYKSEITVEDLPITPSRFRSEVKVNPLPISTYKELALTKSTLRKVIEELDLKNQKTGEPLHVQNLAQQVSVEFHKMYPGQTKLGVSPSGLISFVATGSNPAQITTIANTWARIVADESKKIRVSEASGISPTVYKQYDETHKVVRETEDKLVKWNLKVRLESIDEELKVKRKKLSEYQERLMNKDQLFKLGSIDIESYLKEIKKQPEHLVVSKSISDDALWNQLGSGKKNLSKAKELKLDSEMLNPVRQILAEEYSLLKVKLDAAVPQIKRIKSSIQKVDQEIKEIEKQRAWGLLEKGRLEEELKRNKKFLAILEKKIEEAKIVESQKTSDVRFMGDALEPIYPIAPDKFKIVAIGFLVGLFASLFWVFFAEYMNQPVAAREGQ